MGATGTLKICGLTTCKKAQQKLVLVLTLQYKLGIL